MLLDASLPIPHYVPLAKVNKTMIEVKKTPTDAVQDFMSALCQHALTAIEEAYPQEFLQVLDIKYVISLPVGWPENAVQVIVQVSSASKSNVLEADILTQGGKKRRGEPHN